MRRRLQQERDLVKLRVIVALGATTVLAPKGKALAVGKNRGGADFDGRCGFITAHSSYGCTCRMGMMGIVRSGPRVLKASGAKYSVSYARREL